MKRVELKKPIGLSGEKGLTLIEILLAMALLVVVTGVVFSFMQSAEKVFNRSSSQMKVEGDLSRAMNVIKRDLHEARQGIDTLETCDGDDPDGVCIHTSPALLAFKVPEGTVGTQTTYKTVKYMHDALAETLTREEIASTGPPAVYSDVIGRSITSASFTQSTGDTVLITLQSSARSLVSQMSLRNRAG